MRRATWLVAAAAAVVAGLAAWQLRHSQPTGTVPTRFDELHDGLYRLNHVWVPFSALPFFSVNVATFAVVDNADIILIDTGVPQKHFWEGQHAAIQSLVAETKASVRLLIVQHGHLDHVGTLFETLQTFPDVQVAFHRAEAPYMLEGASYAQVPADNWAYRVIRGLIPKDNLTATLTHGYLFEGDEGDVSEMRDGKGKAPAWTPRAGLLRFLHIPGHSPGQVALLHVPSKSLLPSDAFAHLSWRGKPPALGLPPPGSSCNLSQSVLDVRQLVEGGHFEQAYPAHDSARGVSYAAAREFLASL